MRAFPASGFSHVTAMNKFRQWTMLAAVLAAGLQPMPAWSDAGGVKVVAIVNDQIISSVDLNDRMKLVMAMTGIADTDENRARLASQIVRQLVDEKLQMQEAEHDSITVDDAKVRESITHIEQQNNKPVGSIDEFLESKGAPKSSFTAQIKAQAAWAEIVMRKIRPTIRVSDQEVARYTQRKAAAAETSHANNEGKVGQVMIATILLPVDSPKNEVSVRKVAEKLAEEIHAGASFEAVSSQFSSGAGGPRATEPFWVDASQLDSAIGIALARLKKGDVTNPVKTESGYQIIKLVDVQQSKQEAQAAATAPKKIVPNVELAFRQIILSARQQKGHWRTELQKAGQAVAKMPNACMVKSIPVGDPRAIEVGTTFMRRMSDDMPSNVRDILLALKVGGISDPIATSSGVRLYALCERAEAPPSKQPQVGEEAPSVPDETTRQAIFSEKLELEAQKYMRNLRREAFIDVRGL